MKIIAWNKNKVDNKYSFFAKFESESLPVELFTNYLLGNPTTINGHKIRWNSEPLSGYQTLPACPYFELEFQWNDTICNLGGGFSGGAVIKDIETDQIYLLRPKDLLTLLELIQNKKLISTENNTYKGLFTIQKLRCFYSLIPLEKLPPEAELTNGELYGHQDEDETDSECAAE